MTLFHVPAATNRVQTAEATSTVQWPAVPLGLGFVGLGAGLAVLLAPDALLAVSIGGVLGLASWAYRSGWRPAPERGKQVRPAPAAHVESAGRLGPASVDPAVVLVEAGVVHDDPRAPDTALDGRFARTWLSRATALCRGEESDRLDALARVAGVPRAPLTLSTFDGGVSAWLDGERLGVWESTAALCLDVAALEALAVRASSWSRLTVAARGAVVGALRLLADRCPACGGAVAIDDVPLPRRGHNALVRVGCADCGVTLQELNVDVRDLRNEN